MWVAVLNTVNSPRLLSKLLTLALRLSSVALPEALLKSPLFTVSDLAWTLALLVLLNPCSATILTSPLAVTLPPLLCKSSATLMLPVAKVLLGVMVSTAMSPPPVEVLGGVVMAPVPPVEPVPVPGF